MIQPHTCTKKPIDFVKQEIKTEPNSSSDDNQQVAAENGNNTSCNSSGNGTMIQPTVAFESWRLDHDYCGSVVVKTEIKLEMSLIKEEGEEVKYSDSAAVVKTEKKQQQ